ncbi:hypothetical protein MUP46_00915 [Patescibacteria group bacterium]|nr:hypothetical protein [Patescibacteria group bacterium]
MHNTIRAGSNNYLCIILSKNASIYATTMSKRTIWSTITILLIYFAFTSGSVYEAMRSNIVDKLVVPYSFALSGERTGIVGIYTKDDVQCAKWLNDKGDLSIPIVGDYNAVILLNSFHNIILRELPMILIDNKPVAGHYYIFVRAWNSEKQKIVGLGKGEGLRTIKDWVSLDMTLCQEVFRSGQSVIYEYRNEP